MRKDSLKLVKRIWVVYMMDEVISLTRLFVNLKTRNITYVPYICFASLKSAGK